jgi:hypothetical protein
MVGSQLDRVCEQYEVIDLLIPAANGLIAWNA